ncbi:MAG TPA: hypothetical protein VMM58_13035, partial [Bacteroidota bacterium]|nr:hypothetical protein [Bacteroidota bacterium]
SAGGEMKVGSVLELSSARGNETVTPTALYNQQNPPTYEPVASKLLGANIQLVSMNVDMGSRQSTVTVEVLRPTAMTTPREVLEVEASVKPFIDLVWFGTILLFIGIIISMLRRKQEA